MSLCQGVDFVLDSLPTCIYTITVSSFTFQIHGAAVPVFKNSCNCGNPNLHSLNNGNNTSVAQNSNPLASLLPSAARSAGAQAVSSALASAKSSWDYIDSVLNLYYDRKRCNSSHARSSLTALFQSLLSSKWNTRDLAQKKPSCLLCESFVISYPERDSVLTRFDSLYESEGSRNFCPLFSLLNSLTFTFRPTPDSFELTVSQLHKLSCGSLVVHLSSSPNSKENLHVSHSRRPQASFHHFSTFPCWDSLEDALSRWQWPLNLVEHNQRGVAYRRSRVESRSVCGNGSLDDAIMKREAFVFGRWKTREWLGRFARDPV